MTEIDNKNKIPANTQTRRSILVKFIANFSGGVSPNTMIDSGNTAMAQVSAKMDSRSIHPALKNGGHSTNTLKGTFLELVPYERNVENVVQRFPDKVIHIAAASEDDLMEEAHKPAVISNDHSDIAFGRPAKIYHINVVSTAEKPSKDIEHWFKTSKELKEAA